MSRTLPALGTALLLAGCAVGPPDAPVPRAATDLPEAYGQAEGKGEYEPVEWWRSYQDPVLDSLVEAALVDNLDIGEAIARVSAARARLARERAALFPQVNAGGEANYANQPATGLGAALGQAAQGSGGQGGGNSGTGDPGGGAPPDNGGTQRFSFQTYTAQLQASYEVDFWGRIRNQARAARETYRASIADLQTLRISIASETMRNYFDVVELEQLRDISAAQADILRERVTLAERSFLRGLASSFELISLRESRREAEANVPQIDARLYGAKARLAVLLGTYPDAIDETLAKADRLEVTLAMDAIPAGLPARLLARRPDILAARRRLDAARYGVAAAEAAQLPQITFNASGGLDSGKPGGVLDPQNWFVNLLGSITAPILDGGRLGAQVDLREAELRQRAQSYGRTVLEAFAEVEQALARHEAAVERMELLAADLDSARAAADLQLRRFERGTGNYSDYLDSRLNVLNSRRLMVQAERGVAEARLGVHRALGGAWKRDWLEPVNRERTAMAGGSDG